MSEEKKLADNEEYICKDTLDIEVRMIEGNDEPSVCVMFTGFEDEEDAESYAIFLAEHLPLLLFETTKLH